ncbi:MAG: thiamine-phosphate kinase [Desulfovibrio sp.]|nr:thiamine-phosphate kinase [Desulfovibrio sp.]
MSLPASEDAILACIDSHFPRSGHGLILGRGDDCAILAAQGQRCVSSDLFLEDVHFRRAYFTPEEAGHKALAVNLSDLAAMGARPFVFTLCLGIPEWADMDWLDGFFAGMARLAESSGITLAGGDLTSAPSLHVSITVIGDCIDNGALLLRGGSMPGDILFLVGEIGLSRIGLIELERHGRKALAEWPHSCAAHLLPKPQNDAGVILARTAHSARPPALMDVSDGLAADLRRLLGKSQGGLGAAVRLPDSLLDSEVLQHAWKRGEDPALAAFMGGEDYALLGACAPGLISILQAAIPGLRPIGEITATNSISCNGLNVSELKGFDHFQPEGARDDR